MSQHEEWRPVMDGALEVSSAGKVRRPGKGLARAHDTVAGYPSVSCRIEGKGREFLVHRLVAAAFLGPCPDGKEVNHRDGDKRNNAMDNLEYVTRSENVRHARTIDHSRITREHCPVMIRLYREEKEQFAQAAQAKGLSLAAWIRMLCLAEIRKP